MTKRQHRNTSFFNPDPDDPLDMIISTGANIFINLGLQRFSREAAKILGVSGTSITDEITLNRSRLQLERQQGDNARAQMLAERQVKLLDIKIKEKEAELEERKQRLAAAQEQQAQLSLPKPSEVVTGALEVTATPEGLISPEQSEGYNAWLDSFESGKVILILGRRGSGKTALAAKIGEYMLVTNRMAFFWIGLPREARGLLPHWVNMADSIEQCPPGCLIIIDEAGLHYLSLAFSTEENILLRRFLMICRHKHCSLVFAVQSSRDLENSVVRLADTIIFKEPGLNQPDSERPDLRKRTKKAALVFKEIPKEQKPEAAYVFDDNFEGLIKSSVPSFWSDELSHIYGHFDLTDIQQQFERNNELQTVVVEETRLLNGASRDKQILELKQRGNGIEKIARTLGISTWAVRKCLGNVSR
jgi:hypothetical protein